MKERNEVLIIVQPDEVQPNYIFTIIQFLCLLFFVIFCIYIIFLGINNKFI